jgi:hypothetical protein
MTLFIDKFTAVKIVAVAFVAALFAPIECFAAERTEISDSEIISAIDTAFEDETKKLENDSLARGFIAADTVGEMESDWYILAESAVGKEDDYAAYAEKAETVLEERIKNVGDYYLTEIARTAIAIKICGGTVPDLSAVSLDGVGDNEVAWLAIAQNIGGYDTDSMLEELYGRQDGEGAFGLGSPDKDITAMALNVLPKDSEQALAAVGYLEKAYADCSADGEDISTETAAQIIIGLCSQGINPSSSEGFTTADGVRPIDIVMSRRTDGGFSSSVSGEKNDMSTVQSVLALAVLSHYSVTGESLFSADFARTDIFSDTAMATATNLCGETFDSYDRGVLDGIANAAASDIKLLQQLSQRAETLGADEQTLTEISKKLADSESVKAEIEELNALIREDFYPADKLTLSSLDELSEINRQIETFAEVDRELILSANELSERENKLTENRRELIVAACVAVSITFALIIFVYIKRKKRNEKQGS